MGISDRGVVGPNHGVVLGSTFSKSNVANEDGDLLPFLLKLRWALMPHFHGDKITLGEERSLCTGASSG